MIYIILFLDRFDCIYMGGTSCLVLRGVFLVDIDLVSFAFWVRWERK